jgi:hypothetical protein
VRSAGPWVTAEVQELRRRAKSDGGTNALLTQNGGGPFSIQSIDLAHLESGTFGPQSFTFTGNVFGGGTVSQTFTIGAQLTERKPDV